MPQLLVKYIFTDEALSVQVHPDDQHAQLGGRPRGKDECWLVISAEPGAALGIGFREPMDSRRLVSAAQSGEIVESLAWHPVQPGDFFYIPAGTVHAIGGGIGLIEIQQNSDITYRLYDFERRRELHLEEAAAIAQLGHYDSQLHRSVAPGQTALLVEGPHFRLDQLTGRPDAEMERRYGDRPIVVLARSGRISAGGTRIPEGSCAQVASLGELTVEAGGCCLVTQPCN